MTYSIKGLEEVYEELNSSKEGLTQKEAKERLAKYGKNELKKKKRISILSILYNQFKSFLIIILLIATLIAFLLGQMIDAIVILSIVVLNAILGLVQEYKAEKAIEALKELSALRAVVLREGVQKRILAKDLIPGDIVIISEGDRIPADCRIIYAAELYVDESSLTGESIPVKKEEITLAEKKLIAEQKNMLFSSTIVTRGKAKAIVIGTGMHTEIGKIAEMVQDIKEEPTHLQLKLNQVGKYIAVLILIIAAIVFGVGLLRGIDKLEMFLASISLAVAAIPEGLPAVITVSLALGVQKMIKRNSLIRRLPAVETLGSVNVICADKTGTLTENEMTVKQIYSNDELIDVTGSGYETEGDFLLNNKKYDKNKLKQLFRIASSCNDANLEEGMGDPTELALLVAARKGNVDKKEERIKEIPFSSENKYMVTFHRDDLVFMKGATEVIIEKCSHVYVDGRTRLITGREKEKIKNINARIAEKALRVLAFAYSENGKQEDMVFVGLMGMIDPPRQGVKGSINKCKQAGIEVVMITGDHKLTAVAIANEIEIKGKAITGEELEKLSDEQLRGVKIFARVNPEHKVRILEYFKKNKGIVAMTGDGVNDAPALKKADIGIAMGIKGTEVAKEASDMVLVDDNFNSIVNAVEEGRGIYDNIKKFIYYLLTSNLGEVMVIFFGLTLGLGLPFIAVQILWMNLVTDGLPALALSQEPPTKDIMSQKPRERNIRIIDINMALDMIFIAAITTIGTLFVFSSYGRTTAFTTLVMFQMFNVLNAKSNKSVIKLIFNNNYLLGAIVVSVLLQALLLYTSLSVFFKVEALGIIPWIIAISVGSSVLVFMEVKKYLFPTIN